MPTTHDTPTGLPFLPNHFWRIREQRNMFADGGGFYCIELRRQGRFFSTRVAERTICFFSDELDDDTIRLAAVVLLRDHGLDETTQHFRKNARQKLGDYPPKTLNGDTDAAS